MQQGENPVFLFDKFFKVWHLPYLKFYARKIPRVLLGFIIYSDSSSNFLSFALCLKNVDLDIFNFFIASPEVEPL